MLYIGMVSTVTDNEGVTTKSPVCRVQLLGNSNITLILNTVMYNIL